MRGRKRACTSGRRNDSEVFVSACEPATAIGVNP